MRTTIKTLLSLVTPFFLLAVPMHAQNFGKNKVNYEQLDFRIYETPHFLVYHYVDDEEEIEDFAQLCERWYKRHQAVFLDTLGRKNPIILYNDHADFQQTTVISGLIGVGTGGVTEGLRNRVVMPYNPSNRETSHVLGHEMVHVFQYHMLKSSDSAGLRASRRIPMWMIEGMAEYLSIGRSDVQTSLWMRDAVNHDDIPTLEQMTREPDKYFPYRYGHAFWSYITGHYGDAMVRPLFITSAKWGYREAMDSLLGYTPDSLSKLWARDLKRNYAAYLRETEDHVGEKLFDESNAGKMNIAPSLSPDGEQLIFISDKNVISTDFFLADVEDKSITERITSVVRQSHIDNYSYLESAGAWSPDGEKYAITIFSEGRNQLLIADVQKNRTVKTIDINFLEAFNNPDWSPDGRKILLSGLKEGQSDLYVYHLETQKMEQLTNDPYSDLQPNWSPDGSKIVYVTDRGRSTNLEKLIYGNYRMAVYDIGSGEIHKPGLLPGADIIHPRFSPGGDQIYFVSNADGTRNIYRYDPHSEIVERLTRLKTGVIGLSRLSPCFDISRESEELVYILYNDDGYEIYKSDISELEGERFTSGDVDFSAAELPPVDEGMERIVVDKNLERYPVTPPEKFDLEPYKPKFTLEYVGSAGLGVGTSQFGTGLAGGVSFLFSDILKRNQLMTSIRVNGRIYDIGGQAVYLNQESRLSWGASFTHIPYRSSRAFITADTIESVLVRDLVIMEQRTFEDELGAFAYFPLSKKLRFEGGLSASMYSFRIDSINNYYAGAVKIDEESHKLDAPKPFFVYRAYVAYVGDGSRFGLTSPMSGYRYRFQLDKTFGEVGFWGTRADYRKYFFLPPVGLGFRIMHYGRYGRSADNLYPIYLGNHYFVRGYGYNSLRRNQCADGNCLSYNNLMGSKIVVANAEFRLPFSGPRRLAIIKSGMFFSDIVFFADGGVAWSDVDRVAFEWEPTGDGDHIPVFSAGVSVRLNLFGAIILEPYYAIPFQRKELKGLGTLGFYISAGGF